jgi:DNA polymerase-3 subunit epsilon
MFPTANPKTIQRAQQILSYRPLFIDTETTGTTSSDVIIEIGVVDHEGVPVFESLVRPGIPIPPAATAVHGITEEKVAQAPTWKEIWPELAAVLSGRLIGMYNADFDLRLMKQSHSRYWLDWTLEDKYFFCVMKLYAAFYGQANKRGDGYRLHKLEAAGAQAGIALLNSHRAVDDARLTAALFQYITRYQV